MSPQFLFRIERDPPGIAPGTPYRISDLELASRLSFFLWSSIPDDELLGVAARGKLKDPAVLEHQVRRMLADPRSESLVTNFAEQWLYLRDIEAKKPDEPAFPDFDETLREAFRRETELFLRQCSAARKSQRAGTDDGELHLSSMSGLAKHYGIPNIEGSYFRRVTFPPDSPRGGLAGARQHPDADVLCDPHFAGFARQMGSGEYSVPPPPPPPPNVPALKTEGNEPASR